MHDGVTYKKADAVERIVARKYVQSRYKEVGYISSNDTSEIYTDSYVDCSEYFVGLERSGVVGVLRLVMNTEKSLPVVNVFEFSPQFRDLFSSLSSGCVVEVGNLVAAPGRGIAMHLYAAALSYSFRMRYKYWFAAIDSGYYKKVLERYSFIKLIQVGEPKEYIGSVSVPVMIKLNWIVRFIFLLYYVKRKFLFAPKFLLD